MPSAAAGIATAVLLTRRRVEAAIRVGWAEHAGRSGERSGFYDALERFDGYALHIDPVALQYPPAAESVAAWQQAVEHLLAPVMGSAVFDAARVGGSRSS